VVDLTTWKYSTHEKLEVAAAVRLQKRRRNKTAAAAARGEKSTRRT
jgi:hypothetical protein